MWDELYGRITMVKRSFKLFQPDIAPVFFDSMLGKQKLFELVKDEFHEMLAKNIIKTIQKERSVPIVIFPKRRRNLWFCVHYRKFKARAKQDF